MTDEKYVMKETTLYSAFARMEKNGYISSFSSDEVNGKSGRITGSPMWEKNTTVQSARNGF